MTGGTVLSRLGRGIGRQNFEAARRRAARPGRRFGPIRIALERGIAASRAKPPPDLRISLFFQHTRIGTAVAVLLLASIYADFAIPLEFELDKRGRKTDQPIPLDLMSTRFLGKMVLVVPLLVALAAHLAEPGLLTKDKSKNQ